MVLPAKASRWGDPAPLLAFLHQLGRFFFVGALRCRGSVGRSPGVHGRRCRGEPSSRSLIFLTNVGGRVLVDQGDTVGQQQPSGPRFSDAGPTPTGDALMDRGRSRRSTSASAVIRSRSRIIEDMRYRRGTPRRQQPLDVTVRPGRWPTNAWPRGIGGTTMRTKFGGHAFMEAISVGEPDWRNGEARRNKGPQKL